MGAASLGWICLTIAYQVPPPAVGAGPSPLVRAREAAIEQERRSLRSLADRLEASGQAAEAARVRARVEPAVGPNGPTRFVPLPEVDLGPEPTGKGANAKAAARLPEQAEVETIRKAAAKALFEIATRASTAEPKEYAVADECLRAALARDPGHAEVRRLLGFVPHQGGWATPFAVRQLKEGKVLHPTYGWVPAAWVSHLEQGELPAASAAGAKQVRWLPAAEADEQHREWSRGWTISTEHFEIHTNVPLAEAIRFGRELESLHDLFFSLLADVVGANLPLAQRLQDKTMVGERGGRQPHVIWYFASRDEYVEHVRPVAGPSIEDSLGFYDPPKPGKGKRGRAYFFRDPDGQLPVSATLHHEVSHQLLFESSGPSGYGRNVGHYWVFEGLGTYFETLQTLPDGALEIGGFVGRRIEEAQRRLATGRELFPLAQLVQYDQNAFNAPERVHLHYLEAMALTVYLMQGQGRRYREPFLDYVKDAYRGRLKRTTGRSLGDRLGVPLDRLEEELLEFLQAGVPRREGS